MLCSLFSRVGSRLAKAVEMVAFLVVILKSVQSIEKVFNQNKFIIVLYGNKDFLNRFALPNRKANEKLVNSQNAFVWVCVLVFRQSVVLLSIFWLVDLVTQQCQLCESGLRNVVYSFAVASMNPSTFPTHFVCCVCC